MTTTELIALLAQNEKGGISHKSREISLTINGKYMPNPQITLSSTGDGVVGPEIDLDIDGEFFEEQKPKTEQKTEWISAEDRLPEEDKNVLVCYKCLCDKGYDCIYKTVGVGYCSFFGWYVKGVGVSIRVLAWMPLPEVYEESEVEQ